MPLSSLKKDVCAHLTGAPVTGKAEKPMTWIHTNDTKIRDTNPDLEAH